MFVLLLRWENYCKLRQLYISFAWIARIGTKVFFILTTATTVVHTTYHIEKEQKWHCIAPEKVLHYHNHSTDFSLLHPPLLFIHYLGKWTSRIISTIIQWRWLFDTQTRSLSEFLGKYLILTGHDWLPVLWLYKATFDATGNWDVWSYFSGKGVWKQSCVSWQNFKWIQMIAFNRFSLIC